MNFMWTTPKVHCGTRVLALFEEKMLCPCIIHRSLHQSRYHLCLSDEFQMKFKGERFEYALLFDRGVIVMAPVELSYYYGYEAEQFSFYRIPKLLFTDSRFAGISTDAKLLYGVLLDRMSLSMKNGWHDNQGRVYIIFTLDDVAETLGCKTEKAIKLFHELDTKKGVGLIERVRQGQGRASLIYVKNFAGERQTSEKPKSRPRKNESQDFSHLSEKEQTALLVIMERDEVSPSLGQAKRLKELSEEGKLDANVMDVLLREDKSLARKVTLKNDRLQKYFPPSYTPKQMEEVIIRLLDQWQRKKMREQER